MIRLPKWLPIVLCFALLVGLTTRAWGAEATARGKIKSIEAEKKQFVLTDLAGKDWTFTLGDNAIVRSTGVATSQQSSASEEAKDFKVVVTLTDPPPDLRPGLSTTAKITTAARNNVLTVPIQALSMRSKAQLQQEKSTPGSVHAAAPAPKEVASKTKKDDDMQGVFVVRNKKALFVPVTTGITGTTDIEVLDGLKEGDEVITGSYKVLRTLRPGSSVKIDNTVPQKEEEESS